MSTEDPHQGELLWGQLIEAEQQYMRARARLFASGSDLVRLVKRGLKRPEERFEALTVLKLLDETQRRQLFSQLVGLSSWEHGLLPLVIEVLDSLDRQWVLQHLPEEVQRVIDQATSTKTESSWEEFRLLADLLARYGSPYLSKVLDQANAHSDTDVRDVADWYRKRAAATDQKETN